MQNTNNSDECSIFFPVTVFDNTKQTTVYVCILRN